MKIKDLKMTRLTDASKEKAFNAWTNSTVLSKWWGPKGVTNPVCRVDASPKGEIYIVMLAGDELGDLKGSRWPMSGVIKEVERPNKLVFTSSAIVRDRPILESLVTVKFETFKGKTRITLHIKVIKTTPEAKEALKGMETGWNQSLDKLVNLLKNL